MGWILHECVCDILYPQFYVILFTIFKYSLLICFWYCCHDFIVTCPRGASDNIYVIILTERELRDEADSFEAKVK